MNRFDRLAQEWDTKPQRVEGAMIFADEIKKHLKSDINDFEIADYGSGSGLVAFCFAKDVKSIKGFDNSVGMVDRFNEKAKNIGYTHLEAITHNIETQDISNHQLDMVVSNMTMHHIKSPKEFISKLYDGVKEGGFVAIADLEIEDGRFHSDNDGVKHFGFEPTQIEKIFQEVGFKNIKLNRLTTISKPHNEYHVFFIMGQK
jgi:2-polyprenyl-3-methyl-5-hydroxy-6-metoxy-1,4-benzoquinol methylase